MPVISQAGRSKTISTKTWDFYLVEDKLQLHLTNWKFPFKKDCDEDFADYYVSRFSEQQKTFLALS